ncbi:MAG: hypothetical protein JXB62_18625 [Pirellulales bacterium]|nr:hypothetical protein [Pirellulales bacterium]
MARCTSTLALMSLIVATPISAETISIRSGSTWRTSAGTIAVTPDWIAAVDYDDSDEAGWVDAFKSPAGYLIWHTSNLGPESPNHARFRHVFDLPVAAQTAVMRIAFDDDGSAFINGSEVVADQNGHASSFELSIDPSLFVVGANLIAVDGYNRMAPYNNIGVELDITVVPEPSSLGLLPVLGVLGIVCSCYRHRCA